MRLAPHLAVYSCVCGTYTVREVEARRDGTRDIQPGVMCIHDHPEAPVVEYEMRFLGWVDRQ